MDFDEYLSFCEKVGRTPSGLAEDAGVSRTTISRWKNGTSNPSPENIKRLQTYMYFLMGEEKKLEDRLKISSMNWKDQLENMLLIDTSGSMSSGKKEIFPSLVEGFRAGTTDITEANDSDAVDDKVQSIFDKRMLLFDRTSKLSESDIDIVVALVDRLVGDKE